MVAKNVSSKPRSFFDNLDKGAKTEGASGLGYIILESNNGKLEGKGPIAKFFSEDAINTLCKKINAAGGDAIFFVCDVKKNAEKFSAWARTEIAKNLELIKDNVFEFCWVTIIQCSNIMKLIRKSILVIIHFLCHKHRSI